MTISVITPSFNQAPFLPENLRSVASQSKPALEHIVIDPGSTDGSRDIARRAPGVTLIAEPDEGQSDAICKGFAMAKGEILTWLNSDDYYADAKALEAVAARFQAADKPDVVYGKVIFVDENGKKLKDGYVNKDSEGLRQSFHYQVGIVQPGVFIHRRVFESVGGPPLDMHFTLDYEYWVRIAEAGFKWGYLDSLLACHRWWDGMKTASRRVESLYEHFDTCKKHFGYVHYKWAERQADCILAGADGVVNQASAGKINAAERQAKLKQLLLEANGDADTLARLNNSRDPCLRETAEYMGKLGISNEVPHYFDPQNTNLEVTGFARPGDEKKPVAWRRYSARSAEGIECYGYEVTNNFNVCYERKWLEDQLAHASERISQLSTQRRSDTCIVVGNGPSLRATDFSLFEGHDVIISNFATLDPRLLATASYHTITNFLVAKQGSHQFNRLQGLTKIYPYWLSHFLLPDDKTIYLDALLTPQASTDVRDWISWRSTVSFYNLQLAYGLGFKKVIMVGFDHSYKQDSQAKEGDMIEQREDDENHFLKSYFKGKVWQAADVGEMEKTYIVAKEAFEKAGREIVNCTAGGKLEVFRRADLRDELAPRSPGRSHTTGTKKLPRVLLLDSTPISSLSATGQLKERLFHNWDRKNILQLYSGGQGKLLAWDGRKPSGGEGKALDAVEIHKLIIDFRPEVVYFRPTDDAQAISDFAQRFLDCTQMPYVLHIMDDWPERLRLVSPERYQKWDAALRGYFSRAAARLAIGSKMAGAFKSRYGHDFTPIGNGVETGDFPLLHEPRKEGSPMRLLYSGGMAPDMNLDSILLVAECVSELSRDIPISMEIITMRHWLSQVGNLFSALPSVTLSAADLSSTDYRNKLASSDLLLLAYNFDERSLAYTRYSVGNKLPECLCSGTPLLAIGPEDHATIELARGMPSVLHVGAPDKTVVRESLLSVYKDPSGWAGKALESREAVTSRFSLSAVRNSFESILVKAASSGRGKLEAFAAPKISSPANSVEEELKHLRERLATREQMIANRDRAILEQKEKYAKEHVKVLNRDKAIIDLKSKMLLREGEVKLLKEEVNRLRSAMRKRL